MNIKEIDGAFVNLDLVRYIKVTGETDCWRIEFVYSMIDCYNKDSEVGRTSYKTEEECEAIIRDIIHDNYPRKG